MCFVFIIVLSICVSVDLVEIYGILPGAPQGYCRGPKVSGTLGPLEVGREQSGPRRMRDGKGKASVQERPCFSFPHNAA